ncbi:Dyp-type peroxidase [Caldimonas brevitalea]|uniref:Peroxidase n=1 Tax=Caldimonas brevitalea TaxID=413882 RepID=A0A0G3BS08_9BURK|nr:peroxidase [Caldimonas brevitalea]AKJ30186.1 peroxidase [Caldimonas brevitalea]
MALLEQLKQHGLRRHHAVSLELDDIQATVLRQRPEPYFGTHMLLRLDTPEGGRSLLRRLAPHVRSAADWWDHRDDAWVAVALTYPGLCALQLPEATLQSFPQAFRDGMRARADRLRDSGENAPEHWEAPYGTGEVHVALTIFSGDRDRWHEMLASVRAQLADTAGVSVLGTHDFGARPDSRNPFGYRDNISNPVIEGAGVDPLPGQREAIKAGEFILGYPSESGALLAMPQPERLGRNGTFAVLRKYRSRVGEFNRFLQQHADSDAEREQLAAKLVGRWRSGAPLALAPQHDDPALGRDPRRNNDFDYHDDPDGLKVPLGCHMRRMNPRDTELAVLTDVKLHRIIRRSTSFGPRWRPDLLDDEAEDERGLFFIFMSARAMTTVEFLQQEWINRGNFMRLGDERDPVVGLQSPQSTFTLPRKPVRQRLRDLRTFNVLRGGEYLFMPGLSALRWLAEEQHGG